MARVRRDSVLKRVGLILALLCPLAWLYTGWHLAVESHHDHEVEAHRHDRSHEDDHHSGRDHAHQGHDDDDRRPETDHHPDEAPREDQGHHHDDHLIPDSLRPEQGQPFAIDLTASDVVLVDWHPDAAAPAAAPFDDIPSATDPPLGSLRPRAPPVG